MPLLSRAKPAPPTDPAVSLAAGHASLQAAWDDHKARSDQERKAARRRVREAAQRGECIAPTILQVAPLPSSMPPWWTTRDGPRDDGGAGLAQLEAAATAKHAASAKFTNGAVATGGRLGDREPDSQTISARSQWAALHGRDPAEYDDLYEDDE